MSTPFDLIVRPDNSHAPEPASQGSLGYLRDLMLDKAAHLAPNEAGAAERIQAWVYATGRTRNEVSAQIDRLKNEGYTGRRYRTVDASQPTASPVLGREIQGRSLPTSALPGADVVPEGRYAIPTLDGAVNETAFYKVDRPTEGRWAGYVFVKQLIGPEERRVPFPVTKSVLMRIAEVGAREASAAYGHQIGKCGVCGTRLTNDESRAIGIGPDCRKNMGW